MLCTGALACRPTASPSSQSAPTSRFPRPDELTIVTDPTKAPQPTNFVFPRYPTEPRARREQAEITAAFIIDTTGKVELPSITLLTSPNREFDRSVCVFLERARYTGQAKPVRRLLVATSFVFAITGEHPLPPGPDPRALARSLDSLPRAELAARLTAERHCR
jgi:TonB family protein